MTKDEKIIKAIECCIQVDPEICEKCPLYDSDKGCTLGGDFNLLESALGLIKRQQSEIEKLTKGTDKKYNIFREIGDELFETRRLKRMSQAELEEKSGVTIQTISHIENGTNNSSIKVLKLIADALGKRLSVKFVDFERGDDV